MNNIHSTYRECLQAVRGKGVINPTPDVVAEICPHLTKEDIADIFMEVNAGNICDFAAPPVLIDHSYHVLRLSPPYMRGKVNRPLRLSFVFAQRTAESYADGIPKGDIAGTRKFYEKAIAYAQTNWGDHLILDTWKSYIEVNMLNPQDEDDYGNPRLNYKLFFTTKEDWNTIMNDSSSPRSEVINKSILQITHNQLEANEIKGGRGGYTNYNCTRCSGGLELESCSCCEEKFNNNGFRCGWRTPLPKKLRDYAIDQGFQFDMDPDKALEYERIFYQTNIASSKVC
jgi:hypothetical protein